MKKITPETIALVICLCLALVFSVALFGLPGAVGYLGIIILTGMCLPAGILQLSRMLADWVNDESKS